MNMISVFMFLLAIFRCSHHHEPVSRCQTMLSLHRRVLLLPDPRRSAAQQQSKNDVHISRMALRHCRLLYPH